MNHNWELLEHEGEAFVQDTVRDVHAWQMYGVYSKELEDLADDTEDKVYRILQDIVRTCEENGTFGRTSLMVEMLNEKERTLIAQSGLMSVMVNRLFQLTHDGERRIYPNTRVRITAEKPGLRVQKLPLDRSAFTLFRPIEPGQTVEGRLHNLKTSPSQGGEVMLHGFFRTTSVVGIVNPKNAQPCAKVELFQKA